MQRVLAALFAVLAMAPAMATGWVTNSFRTASGGLVQHGDTMTEVLESAGEPLYQRVISRGITLGGAVGLTREQWTYRGSDGIYVVTFTGDRVAQIEVVPNR